MKECNARIATTRLGKEDHGIPTCEVRLEFDGASQSFGGYDLRGRPDFPLQILEALQVETWEELPGKYCRIRQTHDRIHAIGHIIEDRWFNPVEFYSATKAKTNHG